MLHNIFFVSIAFTVFSLIFSLPATVLVNSNLGSHTSRLSSLPPPLQLVLCCFYRQKISVSALSSLVNPRRFARWGNNKLDTYTIGRTFPCTAWFWRGEQTGAGRRILEGRKALCLGRRGQHGNYLDEQGGRRLEVHPQRVHPLPRLLAGVVEAGVVHRARHRALAVGAELCRKAQGVIHAYCLLNSRASLKW